LDLVLVAIASGLVFSLKFWFPLWSRCALPAIFLILTTRRFMGLVGQAVNYYLAFPRIVECAENFLE
jgi:formate-dependent nitrite reductase membrane component NrfD